MRLVGRPLRMMLVWSTGIGIVAFSLCAVSGADEEWKTITATREPRAWQLAGGSLVTLAAHSKAVYNASSSSLNLRSGRVDIDLTGSRDSVRISTAQVFIRESAGGRQFFVITEDKQTTIGVCRGQVNVLANRGPSKRNADAAAATGTITIEAGEQAIVKSNGETYRESDPPPTCEG